MRIPVLSITTVLIAAGAVPLAAQSNLVLPQSLEDCWGQSSTSLLGQDSTRTQLIFARPFAANTPIRGVGFRRAASTTDSPAFTVDIEIRVSSTNATPGALSPTFANNTGTDEVVALPRQMVTVPAMPANRPTSQFAEFVFPTPFVFGTNGAPNLNVDVLVYGRSANASWTTDRIFGGASGREQLAGTGCGTATIDANSTTNGAGDSYVSGETVTLDLVGATPNSNAVLFPSLDMSEFAPGLPLPFDLSLFGAGAGCDLLLQPTFGGFGFPTDGAGNATFSIPVPATAAEVGIGWQWAYSVPPSASNPLGLEVTALETTFIGPRVAVPNLQYVWDLFDVNSATGTATTDSCPVTLILL